MEHILPDRLNRSNKKSAIFGMDRHLVSLSLFELPEFVTILLANGDDQSTSVRNGEAGSPARL